VQVTYASAGELLDKVAAHERADLVILPLERLTSMEKDGTTIAASRRDLGAVGIGVAVKEGRPCRTCRAKAGLKARCLRPSR